MKRLVLALAAVGLLLPAVAGAAKFAPLDVYWRTTSATTAYGALDSLWAKGDASRFDTTVAVYIGDWGIQPGFPVSEGTPAADSSLFAVVEILPNASQGVTIAVDSVYVRTEVSMDGTTWVGATPTFTFVGAGTTTLFRAVPENNSGNTFGFPLWQVIETTGAPRMVLSGSTAPTTAALFGWKHIRFIVHHFDGAGAFQLRVWRWVR